MGLKRVNIIVSGKVQGVFFRASTREKAIESGIKGWVKNLSDGSVEILAEGEDDNLSEFVEWCKQGPARAKVGDIKIEELPPTGEFDQFDIQY